MNRGMLKLYKTLFIIFSVVFILQGCSLRDFFDQFNNTKIKNKDNNKTIQKPIKQQKIKQIKKQVEPKIQTKQKKEKPQPVLKKAKEPKTIITLMPKTIVKVVATPKKVVHKPQPTTIKPIKIKPTPTKQKQIKPAPKPKKTPSTKIVEKKNIKASTTLKKQNLKEFSFDIIKKGKPDKNTFLVVGGIQGDEPGGFMAATLLATHYKITKGSVWIIPNLNFYSIIKRSRGPFGDMNRKFAYLPKDDPEYEIIQRIKRYITDPHVKLILNLHDGSGFYRPMYIDKTHNPNKWGQSLVIDQEILYNIKEYNDTYSIAKQVVDHINKYLLKKEDKYRVKNTHTRFDKTYEQKEMEKTLTYFAVNNGKAAFGHETSKSLTVSQRVYYKILAIEKYMDIMGIKYTKDFKLTVSSIKHAMEDDVSVVFDDIHIKVPLKNLRNIQKYFPIKKDGVIHYKSSNPLVKIIKQNNLYTVYYGNRRMTKLEADYLEHQYFDTQLNFEVDGKAVKCKFGDTLLVKKEFLVKQPKQFRVNVIGYKTSSGLETNKHIYRNNFIKRYSLEKHGKIYRVEFYKDKKFVGMILVKYIK